MACIGIGNLMVLAVVDAIKNRKIETCIQVKVNKFFMEQGQSFHWIQEGFTIHGPHGLVDKHGRHA